MLGLDLYMNGFLVGSLTKKTSGALYFQYHAKWLQTPGCHPISLSLPLQSARHEGENVYNFFDHLLPDSIEHIRARHFLATAKATGFPETDMQQILDDFIQKTPKVIEQVQAELPAEFPQHITESIFAGMRKQIFRLANNTVGDL